MSLKFQIFSSHRGKFLWNLHWKTRARNYKFQKVINFRRSLYAKESYFQQRMPFVFLPILQHYGLLSCLKVSTILFFPCFLTMFCFLLFYTVLTFFHEETVPSTSVSCQSDCPFTFRQQPISVWLSSFILESPGLKSFHYLLLNSSFYSVRDPYF